jgi:hypothetical protein
MVAMSRPPADPRLAYVPATLRHFAAEHGVDAAHRLMTAFGGQRLYIPHKPQVRTAFVEQLGPQTAAAVCRAFGGGHLDVPMGGQMTTAAKHAAIINSPLSHNQAAKAFGLRRDSVKAIRADARQRDDRQGKLL